MLTGRLDELVESGEYGNLLASVGRQDVYPNLINIVPSRVLMTVDLRNHDAEAMDRAERAFTEYMKETEKKTGVRIQMRTTAQTPPVRFPENMKELVAKSASTIGLSHAEITSGAGHDAGEIAALCPAGMVFIPGMYQGISHNPREYSTPEACADGINVLFQAVTELAGLTGRSEVGGGTPNFYSGP